MRGASAPYRNGVPTPQCHQFRDQELQERREKDVPAARDIESSGLNPVGNLTACEKCQLYPAVGFAQDTSPQLPQLPRVEQLHRFEPNLQIAGSQVSCQNPHHLSVYSLSFPGLTTCSQVKVTAKNTPSNSARKPVRPKMMAGLQTPQKVSPMTSGGNGLSAGTRLAQKPGSYSNTKGPPIWSA